MLVSLVVLGRLRVEEWEVMSSAGGVMRLCCNCSIISIFPPGNKASDTNIVIHDGNVQQLPNVNIFRQPVAIIGGASFLDSGQIRDELANHVVFCPVDLGGFSGLALGVALVSTAKIGQMNFPEKFCQCIHSVTNKTSIQRWNTCSFGVPQSHAI